MRLSKQIVFQTMTFLNSIGDYKHPEIPRFREAYEKTTSQLTRLLSILEIEGGFEIAALNSLYMPKDRILKIEPDKKRVEKLFEHKEAVSMVQVKELGKHNDNFILLIKMLKVFS